MSDRLRIAVAGSTGLVGRTVLAEGSRDPWLQMLALRRAPFAGLGRMQAESFVSDPEHWREGLEAFQPEVFICALGTTWRKAGRNEAAFRAVDHDLVVQVAKAALEHGAFRMVLISSVGADSASKSFYLRVKGETERDLEALGFKRLDILRPGLLRGERGAERRVAERAAIVLSPLTDNLLRGRMRKFRSIAAGEVAQAAVMLACNTAPGLAIHHHDAIRAAAQAWSSQVRG